MIAARVYALLAGLAACGRLDFDLHAAGDAASPDACPLGALGAPRRVAELATITDDFGGWISEDGLELLYSSQLNDYAIYRARRQSTADPFGPPTQLDFGFGGGTADGEDDPMESDDGLTLYFEHSPDDTTATFDLYVATRPTQAEEFGSPKVLVPPSTADHDGAPSVTSDQLLLVFNHDDSGDSNLYQSTRATAQSAFGDAVALSSLNTTGFECCASLAGDGESMLYATDRLTPSSIAIVESRKVGGVFQPPTQLYDRFSMAMAPTSTSTRRATAASSCSARTAPSHLRAATTCTSPSAPACR
jgi:hypothetical protein